MMKAIGAKIKPINCLKSKPTKLNNTVTASIKEMNARSIMATLTAILKPSVALSPIIWKNGTFFDFVSSLFELLLSEYKLEISTSLSSDCYGLMTLAIIKALKILSITAVTTYLGSIICIYEPNIAILTALIPLLVIVFYSSLYNVGIISLIVI